MDDRRPSLSWTKETYTVTTAVNAIRVITALAVVVFSLHFTVSVSIL